VTLLAYRDPVDIAADYLRMAESTTIDAMYMFYKVV
jgi:hypothetical protein